ncbi:MAG: hypothetical protein ACRDTM_04625 [Micromonosporaceae bacterium]
MATDPTNISADADACASSEAAPRTGPLGRIARLVLAGLLIFTGYDLWVDRAFIFAELDPGLLVLTGFAVYGAYHTGAVLRRGKETLIGLAVLAAAAAGLAIVMEGSLWAPPLSWLAWGLDIGLVALVSALLLTATVVGTPGCEVGVLAELIGKLRRQAYRGEAVFCLVGLHKLDAWEARRPWRRPAE